MVGVEDEWDDVAEALVLDLAAGFGCVIDALRLVDDGEDVDNDNLRRNGVGTVLE